MKALMACLLVTLAFAGCTDGDAKYQTPDQDDEGRYVITMINNKFVPQFAKVPVGATVVWINEGNGHNVKADDGSFTSSINSGSPSEPVENHVQVFEAAGTWSYHCVPHQSVGMTGEVKVE